MAKTIPLQVEDNPCSRCTGSWCCTYFTQQIDTPRSREDFDVLLWQVSHEHTEIYKDERFSDHAPLIMDYDWVHER